NSEGGRKNGARRLSISSADAGAPATASTTATSGKKCRIDMVISFWVIVGVWPSLFRDLPDDPARVAGREHAVGDVPRDHAARPDDRPRSDLHAGTNNRPSSDPHVRADVDRLGELLPPSQFGVHRMGGGVNLHGRPEQGVVADGHPAHV